jgi:hypothetical protein
MTFRFCKVLVITPRRMKWVGHVGRLGETRNVYKNLVGKPEEKRPLGRPRRRWENNIIMNLGEIAWKIVDWILLAEDRDKCQVV